MADTDTRPDDHDQPEATAAGHTPVLPAPPGAPPHEGPPLPRLPEPSRTAADRLRFWRSPLGQPAWARPALLGIAAVAAILFTWNITGNGLAPYYSTAVRSMTVSWRALVYGGLDPAATITIDKLAGAFVPQALAARVFGYHPWVLVLPQVVEGIVTVLAMYRIGRRWLGPATGLLAAGLFTTTPVIASMFGHPMEDGLLTMTLVLAADAVVGALVLARPRALLWAGFWVGVGFQAKMMQAWTVLPALALTYLLTAAPTLRRRLAHLALAGAVTVAVSVSWLTLIALTPAADRPYADGSTTNDPFAMAFGYNGLSRLGIHVPGAAPSSFARALGEVPGDHDPDFHRVAHVLGGPGGDQPWTKLVEAGYGSQVGWLYPLALVGLVLGLVRYRRAPRSDPARAGFVLWGLWLLTFAGVLSVIFTPHTAYLASLAPPLAALSAAGIVLAGRGYAEGGRATWVLPFAVAAELAWTLRLASAYPGFRPWLTWTAAALAAVSLAVLLAGRWRAGAARRPGRAAAVAGVVAAAAAMVAVPVGWSASVLDPAYAGSAFDATAGPVPRMFDVSALGATRGRAGPFANVDSVRDMPAPQRRVTEYLLANRGGARYVAATTDGWATVGPYISATGAPFLPMGGFGGTLPVPSLEEFRHLLATGQLRFVLLGAASLTPPPPGPPLPQTPVDTIVAWARSACTDVTADVLGSPPGGAVAAGGTAGGSPGAAPGGPPPLVLLRCPSPPDPVPAASADRLAPIPNP